METFYYFFLENYVSFRRYPRQQISNQYSELLFAFLKGKAKENKNRKLIRASFFDPVYIVFATLTVAIGSCILNAGLLEVAGKWWMAIKGLFTLIKTLLYTLDEFMCCILKQLL